MIDEVMKNVLIAILFQVDDLINVKGKLKLNTDDAEHVNFIITDAVLVKK